MRAEDKEIDGRELEQETRQTESELDEQEEEQLPEARLDEQRELARSERGRLLAAVQAILAREHVVVDTLELPEHERRALDGLKSAVDGRDPLIHQFVYAADRRDLLEQALALLQPNLAYDDAGYEALIERVGELRHELAALEDAQDELIARRDHAVIAKAPPGDAPKPPDSEVDPDAPKPTTLTGPERSAPPKPASTLAGPERSAPPKPASTLAGPEEPEGPRPVTSLGDPEDLATAQPSEAKSKKPWWKRPSG